MFSIIVPTLDEEQYIGSLLDSLTRQTRQDFEVIIVDGGSQDDTRGVVESFRDRIPRLQFVVEEKRGLGRARNVGAARASSDTLVFMEADCWVDRDFFEVVLARAEALGLGCSNVLSVPLSDRWFDHFYYRVFLGWSLLILERLFPVITGYFIYTTRKVFDRIGGFNEAITFEDTDYAQRASKVAPFKIVRCRKLFTSVRRLDSDGRFRCLLRNFLVTAYQAFIGPIRINPRVYAFGHHRTDRFHERMIGEFPFERWKDGREVKPEKKKARPKEDASP